MRIKQKIDQTKRLHVAIIANQIQLTKPIFFSIRQQLFFFSILQRHQIGNNWEDFVTDVATN
jgi:hypothetical protein